MKIMKYVQGTVAAVFLLTGLLVSSAPVAALSATASQRLANIKTKGDQEITRRLNSLQTLTAKINAVAKLTDSDKQALTVQVAAEVSGLTALKTQLDAETTVDAAITDAKNIYNEYRVYALILPKVNLIKNADDQQVTEQKLTALAQKLNTRISNAQTAGKNVAALQTQLAQMQSQTAAAQAISTSIQTSVISLQPADYNSNHTVLNGDMAQLKIAHQDNQAAFDTAKAIVAALKAL